MKALSPGLMALLFSLTPVTGWAQGSDGQAALGIIRGLEADPESQKLAESFVSRARHALSRAKGANDAGDHRHAAELEALARELSETGQDLIRAVRVEQEVRKVVAKAASAETRAIRTQALVEQAAARRGRAALELAALEAERDGATPAPAKATPERVHPVPVKPSQPTPAATRDRESSQ